MCCRLPITMHMRCLFRSTSRCGKLSRPPCRSFARRWNRMGLGWGALVSAMGLLGRAGSRVLGLGVLVGVAAGLPGLLAAGPRVILIL